MPDLSLTQEIAGLGKSLDIPVLDHIIIGDQTWLSLREKKLDF